MILKFGGNIALLIKAEAMLYWFLCKMTNPGGNLESGKRQMTELIYCHGKAKQKKLRVRLHNWVIY